MKNQHHQGEISRVISMQIKQETLDKIQKIAEKENLATNKLIEVMLSKAIYTAAMKGEYQSHYINSLIID